MTCWRCGYGHRDDDGLCRQCASDWFYPPRPPTEAEAGPYGRTQGGGNPLVRKRTGGKTDSFTTKTRI